MEVNQDQIILEEVAPEDMVDLVVETQETAEVPERDMVTKTVEAVAIATAAAVDGNTVKLKDKNYVII